ASQYHRDVLKQTPVAFAAERRVVAAVEVVDEAFQTLILIIAFAEAPYDSPVAADHLVARHQVATVRAVFVTAETVLVVAESARKSHSTEERRARKRGQKRRVAGDESGLRHPFEREVERVFGVGVEAEDESGDDGE